MKHAVVLCAGKGTRMHSDLPKGAFILIDKPMVVQVVDVLSDAGIKDINVVVGHLSEVIEDILKDREVSFSYQKVQNGTASAVMSSKEHLDSLSGDTIILPSDMPLITKNIIESIFNYHEENKNDLTVLTAFLDNPFSYGRIVRSDSKIKEIKEEKDATEEEKQIKEINSGIMVVNNELLFAELSKIKNNNAKMEYYLTDLVKVMLNDGYKVDTFSIKDSESIHGVNDRLMLAKAEDILAERIRNKHLLNGVTIKSPSSVVIGLDVVIGRDVTIEANTLIYGKSVICDEAVVGPNTEIDGSYIGKDTRIRHSLIKSSKVGDYTTVGPFAHIRDNAEIGDRNRVGNFVEVKNSRTGSITKASHLAYIGDAEIGSNVNFGCGAITVNYDGKNKWKTQIGDNAFIGSNSNLIAPIKVEKDAYIACGSTVNKNVPEGALAIGRAYQVTKEGYAEKLRKRAIAKSKENN